MHPMHLAEIENTAWWTKEVSIQQLPWGWMARTIVLKKLLKEQT